MTKSNELDLAWAAGFFEGEGCFYAHYYKPRQDGTRIYSTQASLTQKDEGLLNKFKQVVGFGIVYKSKPAADIYVWKTSRIGETKLLFSLIGKYLGERRCKRFLALDKGEQAQNKHPPRFKQLICKEGHTIAKVGTRKGWCSECNRKYQREWYRKQVARKNAGRT